jgi:hypothetical protein
MDDPTTDPPDQAGGDAQATGEAEAPTAAPIWERLDDEPSYAYLHFCTYRDMGRERTLSGVRRGSDGEVTSHIANLSSTWRWVERAAAYDEHLDRVARLALEDGIRQDRQTYRAKVQREANEIASAAMDAIRAGAEKVKDDPDLAASILRRGTLVWVDARNAEGLALGLNLEEVSE